MRLLDRPLALIALLAIRLYQLLLSRRLNRVCLFRPSCSRRALRYFGEHGFFDGLKRTRFQLQECKGDYSIRLNSQGRCELITCRGTVIPEEEVNPRLVQRVLLFRDLETFVSRSDG